MRLNKKDQSFSKAYQLVFPLDGTQESLIKLSIIKKIFNLNVLVSIFNHQRLLNFQKQNIKTALELFDSDAIMFTLKPSVLSEIQQVNGELVGSLLNIGSDLFAVRIAQKYNLAVSISDLSIDSKRLVHRRSAMELTELEQIREATYSEASRIIIEEDLLGFSSIEDIKCIETVDISIPRDLLSAHEKEIAREFTFQDKLINPKDIIWLGYDSNYIDVMPEDVPARQVVFRDILRTSKKGKALFDGYLDYCSRCCMPITAEGLSLDEMGMCQPCQSSEQKMHLDWSSRSDALKSILSEYSRPGFYDCIVPISGGKDSTYQLHVISKVFQRRVLGCTFSQNLLTSVGRHNLGIAIANFNIDHLMFVPRRKVISKLARKSLKLIGDSCWHCHAGVGSFPLQIAVRFGVKLLIWGESASENDGRATYEVPIKFDRDYFTKISARYYAEDLVDRSLSISDLAPYVLPSEEMINSSGVRGIHLGDYIFWDDERQMEFVRDTYGWREGFVEGTYKGYKSVECVWAGVHDYTKFLKRGFGRATDHASQDVRAGILTREEGFELAKRFDTQRPSALDNFLLVSGYTEEELEEILLSQRYGSAISLPKP